MFRMRFQKSHWELSLPLKSHSLLAHTCRAKASTCLGLLSSEKMFRKRGFQLGWSLLGKAKSRTNRMWLARNIFLPPEVASLQGGDKWLV